MKNSQVKVTEAGLPNFSWSFSVFSEQSFFRPHANNFF